jgi:cold-inducible RNA-binding protein
MNIYVGNLSQEVSEDDLRQAFEKFGTVDSASIIKDKYSSQSKGFGFVEMSSKEEGQKAIEELNSTELKGKTLTVNEARPKTGNRGRGGGRGGFGDGGNRGGFGGSSGYGGGNRGGYGGGNRGGGNRGGSGNRGGQGRGS